MTKVLNSEQKRRTEASVKLCRAVRAHPCLYDPQQTHLSKEVYDRAWKDVASACRDSVPSCKMRWRNIRSSFTRSQQASTALGSKKQHQYRTREYYLRDELEFYIPYMRVNTEENRTSDSDSDCTSSNRYKSSSRMKKRSASDDEDYSLSAEESASDDKSTSSKFRSPSVRKTPAKGSSFIMKRAAVELKRQEGLVNASGRSKSSGNQGKRMQKEENNSVRGKEGRSKTPAGDEVAAADSEGKRQLRPRRSCKRSLDESVIQELQKRPRRISARRATFTPDSFPDYVVETPPKTTATPKKQQQPKAPAKTLAEKSTTKKNKAMEQQMVAPNDDNNESDPPKTQPKESSENQVTVEGPPKSVDLTQIKKDIPAKCDQSVQCDLSALFAWDDEFLKTLRPQMAVMNARQKLYFKKKVYTSLMEVFDDPSDFSGSSEVQNKPSVAVATAPQNNKASNGEMRLIRELSSLVQAAKTTPEVMDPPGVKGVLEIQKTPTASKANDAGQTTKLPITVIESRPKIIAYREADGSGAPRQIIQKVQVNTQLSSSPKKQVLYNFPKDATTHGLRPAKNSSLLMPRIPGSIASSANAAAAAAAASASSASSSSAKAPSNAQIYRPLNAPAFQRATITPMSPSIRYITTVRSPNIKTAGGTPLVRPIARRYSTSGSEDLNASGRADKSKKTVTTSNNTPPSVAKQNSNTSDRRFMKAPVIAQFKQPSTPSSTSALLTKPSPQQQTTRATTVNQFLSDSFSSTPQCKQTNSSRPWEDRSGYPLLYSNEISSSLLSPFATSAGPSQAAAAPKIISSQAQENTRDKRLHELPKTLNGVSSTKDGGSSSVAANRTTAAANQTTAAVIASDQLSSLNQLVKDEITD